MASNLKSLDAALDGIAPATEMNESPKVRKPSVLRQRDSLVSQTASGMMSSTSQMKVDPKNCRMWTRHNRLYDLLTPENCSDLIDDIRAKGRNHTPAIARNLRDDPDGFQYEIIAGARRHFAISFLREQEGMSELHLQIEIRNLSDQEAFLISDAENAGRKDISDYERAKDYAGALADYYDGNVSQMATAIGKKRTSLRNFIYLAEIPNDIVNAFFSPTDIALRYAMPLRPKLNDPKIRNRVLSAAQRISKEQDEARRLGNTQAYDGQSVFKQLLYAAAEEKGQGGAHSSYQPILSNDGNLIFEALKTSRYYTIRIPTKDRATSAQIAKELKKYLT
ncbi:MAG: ParB/RepB/Spo0J family partition protein [Pseudomonadota bacterium]